MNSTRQPLRTFATVLWVGVLVVFAVYCLVASRGPVHLSHRIGAPLAEDWPGTNFKFGIISDTHSFRRPLAQAIEKARANGCSLLIHLGDFVDYDDDVEYRYFLKRSRPETVGLPIFLVRGNHETMSPDGGFSDVYLDHVDRPHYSFEYGGCLFCMLDNSSGALPAGQVSDCRSALAAFRSRSPDGHVFLFAHMPPWYETAPFSGLTQGASADVLDLAAEFRADYIFAGDFHGFVEKEFGPTRLIVSGCGGGSFGAPSEEVHFLEVEVEGKSTAVRKVRVARESEIIARGAYLLYVQVPRYRWYFLCGTIAFLLLEVYHWKRSRRKAKEPQTNSSLPASAES